MAAGTLPGRRDTPSRLVDGGAPLRIAHFIDDLGVGGTQTWLRLLARGLAAHGHDQRVWVVRAIADSVNLADLSRVAHVRVCGAARFYAGTAWMEIGRELSAWRPHVVQTQLPSADFVGRLIARTLRVPVLVSSIRGRGKNRSRWQRWLDRRTVSWAHRVVFNAREVMAEIASRAGVRAEQCVYIPNGVEPRGATRPPQDVRRALGAEPQTIVLGAVSRLHPSKGHDTLLRAFRELRGAWPGAVLWIVGDGPLRAPLEQLSRELGTVGAVHFLGTRHDVPDLLPAMDVFVHPSRWEGMSNALLEAMAAARPVVATRVDGTQSLIVDGQTGWLVEPGDAEGLARRLAHVIRDPDQAARLGRAAAELVARDYSIDRMVARYEALYRELLAGAPSPPK